RNYEAGKPYRNVLPVTTLAADRVTFPVAGASEAPVSAESQIPLWERWNDYGIGLLLEGQQSGAAKGELRQAAEAFAQVEELKRFDGALNLARVYFAEGRLDDAVEALHRASRYRSPAPPAWTLAWLTGLVNRQQGRLDEAIENFRSVLETRTDEMARRGFDFSLDYEVINELGQTLFDRAKQERGELSEARRSELLQDAAVQFEKTLR